MFVILLQNCEKHGINHSHTAVEILRMVSTLLLIRSRYCLLSIYLLETWSCAEWILIVYVPRNYKVSTIVNIEKCLYTVWCFCFWYLVFYLVNLYKKDICSVNHRYDLTIFAVVADEMIYILKCIYFLRTVLVVTTSSIWKNILHLAICILSQLIKL